jgi:hypothetical protein
MLWAGEGLFELARKGGRELIRSRSGVAIVVFVLIGVTIFVATKIKASSSASTTSTGSSGAAGTVVPTASEFSYLGEERLHIV